MKILRTAALLTAVAISVGGCSSPVGPEYYAQQTPALDIEHYFSGTLDAHGMFQDRSGKVEKRFSVLMRCHWHDGTGTLEEDFSYADGSKQHRLWTLHKTAPGHYTGTAPDVVGDASVDVAGNAMRLRYVLQVPSGGTIYKLDFDDWLYLIDDRVMLNRAAMSKFGFGLGSLTVAFNRRGDEDRAP